MNRNRACITLVLSVGLLLTSSPAVAVEQPPYQATVSRLDPETRQLMRGNSWHRGCPVALRDLRLVRLMYWGFDLEAHRGRLVAHRGWADELVIVFRRIYRARFPIRRVLLVDRYGADDQISMRQNNTSAFNCRYVAGTTTWSQHAYGSAIDLGQREVAGGNPLNRLPRRVSSTRQGGARSQTGTRLPFLGSPGTVKARSAAGPLT